MNATTDADETKAMPENARECPTSAGLSQTGRAPLNEDDPASLSDRQLVAIRLLARGISLKAVARKLKIDPKTLYRWRQYPAFGDRLSQRFSNGAPGIEILDLLMASADEHLFLGARLGSAKFLGARELLSGILHPSVSAVKQTQGVMSLPVVWLQRKTS